MKKCWVTQSTEDKFSITIESNDLNLPLIVREITFPDKHTKEMRHTICLKSFTCDDINLLITTLQSAMDQYGQ